MVNIVPHLWAAGILYLLMAVPHVKAHGYLAIPKSRNYLHNSNYCPHCLNAGGVGLTRGTVYPKSGPHGICGDPHLAPREHEAGGKFATGQITGVYEEGGLIHLAAAMSTYHKGFIEYKICRFPAGSPADEKAALTYACLDENILKQADIPGAQVPNGRYYFMGNASDNGFYPPKLFHHTFQLPRGLTCDGVSEKCVLQFHWVTGNSCNDPLIPREYKLAYLNTCGVYGSWPEEFFNCADIKIVPKSAASGITKPDPSWPAFTPALSQGSTGNGNPDPYYEKSPSPPPPPSPSPSFSSPSSSYTNSPSPPSDYTNSPTYSTQSPQYAPYVKPPKPPKALKPPKPPKAMKPPKPPKAMKPPKPRKSPKWRSPPSPAFKTQWG
ncbi:hypothetical protein Ndes2526B_g08133 [Nannochloris sp. 'desiccata']|nr:hypothetical protein KSW81_002767 [Chlorella desiccata (nom. nud.)]